MITLRRFRMIEAALHERGYAKTIEWSETIVPAANAEEFAERTIYVICNSGMANVVARTIYTRCLDALQAQQPVIEVFKHLGKAPAIDTIWSTRQALYDGYLITDDPIAYLGALPWIGEVTALHLAKNLGFDTAKPDVHMERLARGDKTTTEKLCARLAKQTGYRAATIDSILWRACADRILNSAIYEQSGWRTAFNPDRHKSSDELSKK